MNAENCQLFSGRVKMASPLFTRLGTRALDKQKRPNRN